MAEYYSVIIIILSIILLLFWASLIAQVVKNPPAMQETLVRFLGRKDPLEKDRLPTPVFLGFPVAQLVKNMPAMQETWV